MSSTAPSGRRPWCNAPFVAYAISRAGKQEFYNFGQVTEATDPVMQSAGLTDKNGTEIFEGDVMTWPTKMEGIWSDQAANVIEVRHPFICGNAHLGEVIGNIYENPDLLHQAA